MKIINKMMVIHDKEMKVVSYRKKYREYDSGYSQQRCHDYPVGSQVLLSDYLRLQIIVEHSDEKPPVE
tara:strand:+ start:185 stop:388 length:204 start_codon:yes stop_codon:yes gene_type:complete